MHVVTGRAGFCIIFVLQIKRVAIHTIFVEANTWEILAIAKYYIMVSII